MDKLIWILPTMGYLIIMFILALYNTYKPTKQKKGGRIAPPDPLDPARPGRPPID